MKKSGLILALLIIVTLTIFVFPVRSEDTGDFTLVNVYWGTDQLIEVSPGDVAPLTVVVRYEYDISFSNLKANLSLPNGFEAVGSGDSVSTYFTGMISPGSLLKLEFPIFATLDLEKDNYTADLELEYYFSKYVIIKDTLAIPFEVSGKPHIKMKTFNDSFNEGKQQFSITLSNDGDAAAKNLEILRVYSSSASVELVHDEFLGKLASEDHVSVPLSLFVPTGMKGRVLPLTVEISYLGPKNVIYLFSETLQLPIKPSNPIVPLSINLEESELSIGKSSTVYIDLANKGSSSLSEIKITLSPDNTLRIFGPTVLYIDNLSPEESKRIETEIYVPSTTVVPTGSLTVTTTYLNENLVSQGEIYQLNILLRGSIDISLTDAAVIPSTPSSGSPFSITITVTNIGTSTAYAAYAIPLLEDLPLKPFGPKSTYIGNIETNFPTTFTVNLQVENTTSKSITLPVTLSYMDNLRSLDNVTFNIPIIITGQTDSPSQPTQNVRYFSGMGLLIIGIVAIIAVAIVIIVVKRLRRPR